MKFIIKNEDVETEADLQVLNIKENDIIILKTKYDKLDSVQIQNISDTLKKLFPDNESLVIDESDEIGIIRK